MQQLGPYCLITSAAFQINLSVQGDDQGSKQR
jgi:hypothetical protein